MSRILLKVSGGSLKTSDNIVDKEKLNMVYETVKKLKDNNHLVSIVIGGGNLFRGREHPDMENINGDTIGMLSSVINALYLKDYLERKNIDTCITTPFSFPNLISNYNEEELITKYNDGSVIIFGGGIGMSGYSTDSGVVKASNILNNDLIIKLTNVDGVYNGDPKINEKVEKFDYLTYDEVSEHDYKIMDRYAIMEIKKKNIKILVMNFNKYQDILKYFDGIVIGTVIG